MPSAPAGHVPSDLCVGFGGYWRENFFVLFVYNYATKIALIAMHLYDGVIKETFAIIVQVLESSWGFNEAIFLPDEYFCALFRQSARVLKLPQFSILDPEIFSWIVYLLYKYHWRKEKLRKYTKVWHSKVLCAFGARGCETKLGLVSSALELVGRGYPLLYVDLIYVTWMRAHYVSMDWL